MCLVLVVTGQIPQIKYVGRYNHDNNSFVKINQQLFIFIIYSRYIQLLLSVNLK